MFSRSLPLICTTSILKRYRIHFHALQDGRVKAQMGMRRDEMAISPPPPPEVCDSRHCCTKRPHAFEEQKGGKRRRVGRTRSAPPAPSTFQLRSLTYKLDLCPRGAATGRPHASPPAPSAAPHVPRWSCPRRRAVSAEEATFVPETNKQTKRRTEPAGLSLEYLRYRCLSRGNEDVAATPILPRIPSA